MSVNFGTYIERADTALSKLDVVTQKQLEKQLLLSLNRLESEIQRKWGDALTDVAGRDIPFAEARARAILAQLKATLSLIDPSSAERLLSSHLREVSGLEIESAHEMVSAIDKVKAFSQVPVETIGVLASNATARLVAHGEAFALRATGVVIRGLVSGSGFQKMARELRTETGITLARAETIVRTETMNASDIARRSGYREAKIDYVQRIATQDRRVCGYCAARAGNVYEIDEAPQSLHPNDRCYNAPWKREWHDAGLIDVEWTRKHAAEAAERSEEPVRRGPAPFEKAAGKQPPTAIWTPRGGFQ